MTLKANTNYCGYNIYRVTYSYRWYPEQEFEKVFISVDEYNIHEYMKDESFYNYSIVLQEEDISCIILEEVEKEPNILKRIWSSILEYLK